MFVCLLVCCHAGVLPVPLPPVVPVSVHAFLEGPAVLHCAPYATVPLRVRVVNRGFAPRTLTVALAASQDWATGSHDTAMAGKVAWLGAVDAVWPEIAAGHAASHASTALFLCPGTYCLSATVTDAATGQPPAGMPPVDAVVVHVA